MKIERSLKIRDRAVASIRRLYDYIADVSLPQERELEMLGDIRRYLGDSKAPRWVVSYVEGFRDCRRGMVMAENTEFLYTCRGKLVSTEKGHELDMRKHGITHEMIATEATSSGFYWKKSHLPYFLGNA